MISRAAFAATQSEDCKQYVDFLYTDPKFNDVEHVYQMIYERDVFKHASKQELISYFKDSIKLPGVARMLKKVIYTKAIQTRNLRLLKVLEELFDGQIIHQVRSIIKYEYIEVLEIFKPTFDRYKDYINGSSLNTMMAFDICNNNKPHLFYLVDPSQFNADDVNSLRFVMHKLHLDFDQYRYVYQLMPESLKTHLLVRDIDLYVKLKNLGYEFNLLNLSCLKCNSPAQIKAIIDDCYKDRFVEKAEVEGLRFGSDINYLVLCMCMPYINMDNGLKMILTRHFSHLCIYMIKGYDPAVHNFKLFMFTVGRYCDIILAHHKIYSMICGNPRHLDLYKQLLVTELKLRVALTQAKKNQLYIHRGMDPDNPFWAAYNSYCMELGDEVGIEISKIRI